MFTKIVRPTLLALVFVLFVSRSYAATLQLLKIGSLDTGGKVYSEWWYTVANPLLSGKAAPTSDVTVKIESTSNTVKSDASGNWSYQATLPTGDHTVAISQGSETVSFTLHVGQNLPANLGGTTSQTTQSTSTVPLTGYNQIFAMLFGLGVILLASYFYIRGDTDRKKIFESKMIRE
jgi:hypothetical protein